MKKLFLFLFVLVVAVAVKAGEVTESQALQKAQQFLSWKQFQGTGTARKVKGAAQTATANSFYVFNVEDDGGFVIVSGDDRTKEILGYALSGHLDMNDLPDNLRWWLDYYASAISSLDKKYSPTKTITKSIKKEISPLIKTQWHQKSPYNDQCVINGTQCLTGCVATAMAQVMNYWQWPESTDGVPSYTFNSQMVDALPATTFNWTDMTDDDMAKLCRYCGQSVEMEYGEDASSARSASIPYAAVNYFGYDPGAHVAFRNSFRPADWEELIYNELAEERPVVYDGHSTTGYGHSFICDGYKNGLFHVNWGWGGYKDSYFVLTIMDSFGSGNVDETYSESQMAVIGLQKPNGGSADFPLLSVDELMTKPTGEVTRESSENDFPSINVSWKASISVNSSTNVQLFVALYKGEEKISDLVQYDDMLLIPNVYYSHVLDIQFGSGLSDGTYRIVLYYTDGSGIHYPQGFDYRYIEAVIEGNTMTLTNYPVESDGYTVGDQFTYETDEGNFNCRVTSISPKTVEITGAEMSSSSTVVRVPGVINGYKVNGIGQSAFYSQEEVTELYLPASIEYITNADDADFPTFWNMRRLQKIVVDEANPYFDSRNNCNAIIEKANGQLHRGCKNTVIPDDVKIIGPAAFSHDNGFTVGTLPDGITKIAPWAFYATNADVDIILPQSLETLGNYAMSKISPVRVVFPEHTTYIGKNAFNDDAGVNLVNNGTFTILNLPKDIVTMADGAFSHCPWLRSICSPSTTPPAIDESVFMAQRYSSSGYVNWEIEYERPVLYVPAEALESYKSTSSWSKFKKVSTISDKGDVNGDHAVNDSDVSDLAEYLVSKSDKLPCQGGDLDKDGWVDVHDIYNLTELLRGNATMPYAEGKVTVTNPVMELENSTTITPKKPGKVNVFLNNADFDATALNWAVTFPDGIEPVKQSDGHYVTMTDRMADNFVLYDYVKDNVLQVLAYRKDNHVIESLPTSSYIADGDIEVKYVSSKSPVMSFLVRIKDGADPVVDEYGYIQNTIDFVIDSENDGNDGIDNLVTGRERRGNLTIDDTGKAWVTHGAYCYVKIGEDVTIPGDVNCDGELNSQDIVDVVNHMMGLPASTGVFDETAADLNNDNVVDVADIVILVNMLMNTY